MGFLEAVRTCIFRKYFVFRGRASRAEYWWFVLFNLLITIPLALLGPLLFVVGIVLVVPQLAVGVRRLHDTNRSGWWLALSAAGWIPLVGWIASLVLLWFLIQRGDAGDNRYGRNPAAAVPGAAWAPPPPPASPG